MTMANPSALCEIFNYHLSTAVLLFDQDLRLEAMNTAAEDLLFVSQRQVLGMKVDQIIPADSNFSDSMGRSFSTGTAYSEWALQLQLANDKTITVDCVFTPIKLNGDHTHLLVEMTNSNFYNRISREKSLIEQNLTSKEWGRALAHEIKNPLGGLRGAAQLLRNELENEELKEYTDIIINEADRLRNLVDNMLAPDKELKFSNENIHEILQYVWHLINADSKSGCKLICDYDPSLPEILADRESLVQVFLNLIRNAIQAMNDTGDIILRTRVAQKVTIAQRMYKLCLKVEIIDDGPGVPEDLIDRIFYPMITTRPDGSGLGLPIAQSLIQKHGGIIEYHRINQQTVFTVLLPWRDYHEN